MKTLRPATSLDVIACWGLQLPGFLSIVVGILAGELATVIGGAALWWIGRDLEREVADILGPRWGRR